MRKIIIAVGLLVVVIAAWLATQRALPISREELLSALGQALGVEVTAASVEGSGSSVELRDLRSTAAGAEPALAVELVRIHIPYSATWNAKTQATQLDLIAPHLTLTRSASGLRLGEATTAVPLGALAVLPERVHVERADVRFRDVTTDPVVSADLRAVDLDLSPGASSTERQFKFHGGVNSTTPNLALSGTADIGSKGIHLKGKGNIQALERAAINDAEIEATFAGATAFEVQRFAGRIFGGRFELAADVDRNEKGAPALHIKGHADGLQIAQFQAGITTDAADAARGNASLTVDAKISDGLVGTGTLDVTDVSLRDINILAQLMPERPGSLDLKQWFPLSVRAKHEELSRQSTSIKRGHADITSTVPTQSADLSIVAGEYQINAQLRKSGDSGDLGTAQITLSAALSADLVAAESALGDLRTPSGEIVLPLLLHGDLSTLRSSLDTSRLSETAKSNAKLKALLAASPATETSTEASAPSS